jgi:hypothetical protein
LSIWLSLVVVEAGEIEEAVGALVVSELEPDYLSQLEPITQLLWVVEVLVRVTVAIKGQVAMILYFLP